MSFTKVKPVCTINRPDQSSLLILEDKDYTNPRGNFGFCNQIFILTSRIIEAHAENNKILIVDGFMKCIKSGETMLYSEILDFKMTMDNLEKIFGYRMLLCDRNTVSVELLNAEYGLKPIQVVNVTEKMGNLKLLEKYNNIFEDKVLNIRKKLYLTLLVNGEKVDIEHNENESFDYSNFGITSSIFENQKVEHFWSDTHNKDFFDIILKNLVFDKKMYEIVASLNYEPMNIVHLRMEDDWLNFLSMKEKIPKCVIFKQLTNMYRKNLAKGYLSREIPTFFLTSKTSDIFSILGDDYNNEYNILFLEYEKKEGLILEKFGKTGREMCALLEFIIAKQHGTTFLGQFDTKLNSGSSYSYFISVFIENSSLVSLNG